MNSNNLIDDDEKARSTFVRKLVQQPSGRVAVPAEDAHKIPKRIVQFWDNLNHLPIDVRECIETWKATERWGVESLLFDSQQAGDFIYEKLGLRHKQAFEKCYHPAMQSDYFRLCYIFIEGGCYIDTDDVYSGFEIQHLFDNSQLKIQPLCYDVKTHTMVPPQTFTKLGEYEASWIFYFNNNPLIACSRHPIIEHALAQATSSLEKNLRSGLPEIQSTTGPGNLTKAIFDVVTKNAEIKESLLVLNNWEDIAKSKWELSYRNDSRNWRLSNCQTYIKS